MKNIKPLLEQDCNQKREDYNAVVDGSEWFLLHPKIKRSEFGSKREVHKGGDAE